MLPLIRCGGPGCRDRRAGRGQRADDDDCCAGDQTVKYVGTEELRAAAADRLRRPGQQHVLRRVHEVVYGPAGAVRRYDVVLWVNGIPLVVIETKTPVDALEVVAQRCPGPGAGSTPVEGPAFFASNVLMAGTEGRDFHYGAVGQAGRGLAAVGLDRRPLRTSTASSGSRSPSTDCSPRPGCCRCCSEFVLFERTRSRRRCTSCCARYPQVEAAEAIHERVLQRKRRRSRSRTSRAPARRC